MRRTMLAAVAALGLAPAAADPLSVKPAGYGDFFNAAAKTARLPMRLALARCDQAGSPCVYQTSTGIYCYAVARRGPNVEEVTCILASKEGAGDWIALMNMLPAQFSPTASADERGVAVKSLLRGFGSGADGSKGQIMLRGVEYTLQIVPGMGVWLTADALPE